MIVVGALLAGLASVFMSASYMATAQLSVNSRGAGAADAPGPAGGPVAPAAGSEDSTIDTHVTVLLSDAYLRRLLPTLRTLDGARHGKAVESPTWLTRARTLVGTAWSKTKALLMISQRQPSDGAALAGLRSRLKVGQERRSRIISVSFTDIDPARAAETANLIARSYVDELTRQKQAIETQALNAVAIQSAAIQQELAKAKEEMEAIPSGQAAASQRAALEWRVTTLAQQFEMLLRRRQELTTKGLTIEPEVTVIADASPPELPSSLNPLLLIPPVTIAFALLACLLAVVFHRFDRTLHTEAEATEALRIPCAGLIPAIPPEMSRQPRRILEQPTTAYTRAIRSTVVSLLASDPVVSQPKRVVLVTSSIRGEGKTAVSWSFGFYAAQLGRRVLLLDFASFRRPGGDTVDLFRVLTKDRPFTDAIQHVPELGIDYLSAGPSDGNRLWMLANPKMPPLIEQLRDAYDLVVIDAPSLQDAPEVRLLTRWADHIMLAIRFGSTTRDVAQAALHRLALTEHLDVGTKFWSVLTRRDPADHASQDWKKSTTSKVLSYRRLKEAMARWMKIRPEVDGSDPA